MGRSLLRVLAVAGCVVGCATGAPAPTSLPLRRVVLYRNGLGYFEHSGRLASDHLQMHLRAGEVDDVIKTLAVLAPEDKAAVGAVAALKKVNDDGDVELDLSVPTNREVTVSYAAPTPVWRSTYKLVLGEGDDGLLQTWAVVNNNSDEDWQGVRLTLATGAPFSYVVDLHSDQFGSRPDGTRRILAPPINGVVAPERTDADRDHDGIPDSRDKCPNEPETYNGYEDADGCPDKGRVITRKGTLEILDKVYFASGSHAIKHEVESLLDVIAATLKGYPQLKLVAIDGYSADDERDPIAVATARATAVRDALVARGILAERLRVHGYGASRALCTARTEDCRSQNRRVGFSILERAEPREQMVKQEGMNKIVERSASGRSAVDLDLGGPPAPARPAEVAGMMRYEIGVPVTIPGRSSAMVAIENRRLPAAEVYLYRPDANAPGSDAHPYRAARFVCPPGNVLEGGPLAIYARGTFVGDAILDPLRPGQSSLVPFALDPEATVRVTQDGESKPLRLIKIEHGIFTVEDRRILRTHYDVAAGGTPRAQIFVRYDPRTGYEVASLPPGSEREGEAALVPVALGADGRATLTLEETRAEQRAVNLTQKEDLDLGAYLAGTAALPAGLAERLRRLDTLRAEAEHLDVSQELLRRQTDDSAQRLTELQDNLQAIEKNPAAGALRKQLNDELAKAVRANEELSKKTAELVAARDVKRAQLRTELEVLTYDHAL
ncbi:MAG TPA: OmpA family protein [Polyangia bacterium]|nr:OmpA family protein [Polyangia bacterium]